MNFEYLEVRKGGLPPLFQGVSKVLRQAFPVFQVTIPIWIHEFQKSGGKPTFLTVRF
jgi:hypothetical protein